MITFPLKTNKEDAAVSPLFGKAKYFAFYDGKELTIEENPYNKGTKLIDWFIEKGVDTLVIKEFGKKSFTAVTNKKLKVLFAGEQRVTIKKLLEDFDNNLLKELSYEELLEVTKNHKGAKDSSSCGSKESNHSHSCHKKMKAQNPFVFL